MADALLSTKNLTIKFGDFTAVDDVSLSIKKGSITGLIGPNGAGKSTLFNALTGNLRPSSGDILYKGQSVMGQTSDQLFAAGLGRTFQLPRPFKKMTVLENLMVAPMAQRGERVYASLFKARDVAMEEKALREKAMDLLAFVTLDKVADQDAGQISGGQMKLLDLARLLMGNPDLILLDEPAAGVHPHLSKILLDRIEVLNGQGKTFLIIEHDMDLIMRHCDPIIALASGKVVFEGSAAEAQKDPLLLDAYLGGVPA